MSQNSFTEHNIITLSNVKITKKSNASAKSADVYGVTEMKKSFQMVFKIMQTDKGKPAERRGRKVSGLREHSPPMIAEPAGL